MRMWQIVNVGIIAMIAAGCATPHATPRALAPLSCGAGQRIVIVASPVESPDVASIIKRSGSMHFVPFITPNPFNPRTPWLQTAIFSDVKFENVTPEFKKAIRAVLVSVDLQQLLLARAEQVIKPRTSCDTAFLPTTWEKPATFRPSDRVIVISLYSKFASKFIVDPPVFMGYLSAMVMTGENAAELAKRADETGKIMEEMKNLEPYVKVEPSGIISSVLTSPVRLGKLEQYRALGQKLGAVLMPYIDGAGTMNYTSPGHSSDEWLANGGAVTKQEISAVMDRLIGDVAGILLK